MNAKRLFGSLTALVFASCALAWDPAQRDCSDIPLCLTSFIWCRDGGCSFPPGAYQWSSDANTVNPALLLDDKVYKVTWKTDNNLPVRLRWEFGTTSERLRWETSKSSHSHQVILNGSRLGTSSLLALRVTCANHIDIP